MINKPSGGLVYGYTIAEDYAKGLIPDSFGMDYLAKTHIESDAFHLFGVSDLPKPASS